MKTLEEVRIALRTTLGDEARYRLVSARVTLRTGVNLSAIPPHLLHDSKTVEKVINALGSMGLALHAPPRR